MHTFNILTLGVLSLSLVSGKEINRNLRDNTAIRNLQRSKPACFIAKCDIFTSQDSCVDDVITSLNGLGYWDIKFQGKKTMTFTTHTVDPSLIHGITCAKDPRMKFICHQEAEC